MTKALFLIFGNRDVGAWYRCRLAPPIQHIVALADMVGDLCQVYANTVLGRLGRPRPPEITSYVGQGNDVLRLRPW